MIVECTMHSMESSNIEAIGYNHQHQTMQVNFKGNRKYQYHKVPFEVYQQVKDAKHSVGDKFVELIRNNKAYKYEQI